MAGALDVAIALRSRPLHNTGTVGNRAVSGWLPLTGNFGDRHFNADDGFEQLRLDVIGRCIGNLPGIRSAGLVSLRQHLDDGAQLLRVLD